MKKHIYGLIIAVTTMAFLTACEEEMGTEPGNDSQATVTLYQYAAGNEYDGDCDVAIRIAANSATTEAYAMVEKKETKEQKVASVGEEGYADYVIQNGEKLTGINGASVQDKVFTGLNGECIITVVAVGNGNRKAAQTSFTGITWSDVAKGTYYFSVANIVKIYAESQETTLQVCDSDPTAYRFKDLFGKNSHLKFVKTSSQYKDGGTVCRVPAQSTPLVFGNYGEVGIRDVATWQNDDNYLDCALYSDNYFYAWVQYYVTAGNMGYGYDEFYPEN
ncbi:MAG: hypothetical protein ACI4B3_07420 [Prevotella sp.]